MIDPKNLKKWFFLIAALYLLMPRDLIPDFAGRGLGLIDDVVLMGALTYFFRKHVRQYMAHQRASEQASGSEQAPGPEPDSFSADSDPYAILGISRPADQQEIQAAYRERMREYHPDKVAHLGEDLQKLAHQRSLEIQQAYQSLRR